MEARPLLELLELAAERERLERESGLTLRRAREAAGLSQGAFASMVGVSQPYVSQIEKGVRSVTSAQLQVFQEKLAAHAKTTTTQGGKSANNKRTRRDKARA